MCKSLNGSLSDGLVMGNVNSVLVSTPTERKDLIILLRMDMVSPFLFLLASMRRGFTLDTFFFNIFLP
ncbi:Uncharacterised protein [Yersinia intermedia]|nr:Uncharacterised protein [Yersinia intermedia]CNH37765.1 Uncharacterised protein [Yersinia intermedia]